MFDLDETLIHCRRDIDELHDAVENFSTDKELLIEDPASGEAIKASFSVRPYTRECLELANKYYEVAIFTAGNEWFADKIIDYLDP